MKKTSEKSDIKEPEKKAAAEKSVKKAGLGKTVTKDPAVKTVTKEPSGKTVTKEPSAKTATKDPAKTVTRGAASAADTKAADTLTPDENPLALARLKKAPKIVSKDTNTIEGDLYDFTVDPTMFDDENWVESVEDTQPLSRSRSIDESALLRRTSYETKERKRKKGQPNIDFSSAERYNPDYKDGLSIPEVEKRMEDGYVNVISGKRGKSYHSIFVSNIFTFFNIMIFIVAAALIATGASFTQLFFLVIIVANITIGIIQEIKSKRAVDKLSLISAPSAIVIRGGEKLSIPISEIVLDDILYLETGKQISADAIVIKGDVEVNESMLTGESDSMKKPEGALLFSGSFVTSGTCYARVEKVGEANYVETLTSVAKRYKKPKSELQNAIKLIMKFASILIVPITIIMIYTNYKTQAVDLQNTWDGWVKIIQDVSGAVIGMLPAGMFLLTSTALTVSVLRLAKKRTLVQDLYCIEMLARVDCLCLDKTGTITDGTMQINNVIELKGLEGDQNLKDILGSMLTATGDNNQTALAIANYFGYSHALTPTAVMPFSSKRKLSAVSFDGAGTYMLGAPEFVLKDIGVRIERIVNENAANGYRVLVVAHSPTEIINNKLPTVRRPLALIVIEDHIRDDAAQTIAWFKDNNVAVKVISGDNPITVSEVARRVGVENAELYISLDGLSDREVVESAGKYTVFGRVTPEQKRLLVKSLKRLGKTVAMTGDGVNDIMAMKEADCSVTVASGAEAVRNISHLVLMDSSFTAMPDVVREGRRVINNIQKSSSLFLMKTFMSVVLAIIFLFIPITAGNAAFKGYPFLTNNLLLFELCVIGLSSFVLALQSNHSLVKGKFLSNVIGRSVPSGITLVVATMLVFWYCNYAITSSLELYRTMLVLTLTYAGYMMLAKISEPFDMVRVILLVGVAVLTVIGITVTPLAESFGIYLGLLNTQHVLFIIVVVLGSYFFVSTMMKIMRLMKVIA